jgi:glycerol-3-phosphate acyltransferase PlsX
VTVIALDGMGGDLGPEATVAGAIEAASDGLQVLLVGDEAVLRERIAQHGTAPSTLRVVHAADSIGMGEQVAREVRRRKQSSIWVGMELVKSGEAQAFVSMGNTGAMLAAALLALGRIKGVERPGLAILLPTPGGPTLLIDGGANAEARPSHLLQFAEMGAAYMRAMYGYEQPRVGLLSIGEEASKGSSLIVGAHTLLRAAPQINFIGNMEGGDVITGEYQVVTTDGFAGNNALKLIEGTVQMMFDVMRREASSSIRGRIGGALLLPALREVRGRLDYRRYGAAPLLGVNGKVFIGHGRSDSGAIANAVRTAEEADRHGVLDQVRAAMGTEARPASSGEDLEAAPAASTMPTTSTAPAVD